MASRKSPRRSLRPIALGTVANLEQEVSAALAPAHQKALEAVRQADVKFADETGWKLWGKLCWLWAAATTNVAVFVIHAKRSSLGLAALLGEEIHGILHSDRWHVYLQIPDECRQLCSAHLKRDFQKLWAAAARVFSWAAGGFGSSKNSSPRGMRFKKERSRGENCKP